MPFQQSAAVSPNIAMKLRSGTITIASCDPKDPADIAAPETSTEGVTSGSSSNHNAKTVNRSKKQLQKSKKKPKQKRKKPSSKKPSSKKWQGFKFVACIKEDHAVPLNGCQFYNNPQEDEPPIFAVVGGNRVTIYKCVTNRETEKIAQYNDSAKKEIFYTCAWSHDYETGLPIIAFAGWRGIIQISDALPTMISKPLYGHLLSVYDVKFHPLQPYMLLSASEDRSIRLWNIKTEFCVATFGGSGEHIDQVLSVDFDTLGSRIISGGMDRTIIIWDLNKVGIQKAMRKSYKQNLEGRKPLSVSTSMFSTRAPKYVACEQWLGEYVLSKSCQNSIVWWKPGPLGELEFSEAGEKKASVLMSLKVPYTQAKFIRFALDYNQTHLAIGNEKGKTFVWKFDNYDLTSSKCCVLSHAKCKSIVRHSTFSQDCGILICVCDDGTIWRWKKVSK